MQKHSTPPPPLCCLVFVSNFFNLKGEKKCFLTCFNINRMSTHADVDEDVSVTALRIISSDKVLQVIPYLTAM